MVNININIQKKDLWLLSALAMFLVGVGFVIAGAGQGIIPNPGHGLDTIQGYNSDDTDLGVTLDNLTNDIIILQTTINNLQTTIVNLQANISALESGSGGATGSYSYVNDVGCGSGSLTFTNGRFTSGSQAPSSCN